MMMNKTRNPRFQDRDSYNLHRSDIFIMADLHTGKPITLKCGLTLPNRLVKAATAESMAPNNTLPDEKFQNLYRHWAEGGWGMVLAGTHSISP